MIKLVTRIDINVSTTAAEMRPNQRK